MLLDLDIEHNATNISEWGVYLEEIAKFFGLSRADILKFSMVNSRTLSKQNATRGDFLVIVGHGSPTEFMGLSEAQLINDLMTRGGLEDGAFDKIYLMGCNLASAPEAPPAGYAPLGGSSPSTDVYLTNFQHALAARGISACAYAPQGKISLEMTKDKRGPGSVGDKYKPHAVGRLCIKNHHNDNCTALEMGMLIPGK